MEKIIIAAQSKNGIIGRQGSIPWHIKEELQHFKSATMGFPVIMGRKTFQSIRKPLKGRLNVIITRDKNYQTEFIEVKTVNDLESALELCEKEKAEKVFIIGGGEIYNQSINISDILLLSIMKFETEGDTYFPEIDPALWEKVSEDDHELFTVVKYIRKRLEQNEK